MNCHLEATYSDGKKVRLETRPNGDLNHVYPSRGWACASATQWVDSFVTAFKNGKVSEEETPLSVDIVLEESGKLYKSLKVK